MKSNKRKQISNPMLSMMCALFPVFLLTVYSNMAAAQSSMAKNKIVQNAIAPAQDNSNELSLLAEDQIVLTFNLYAESGKDMVHQAKFIGFSRSENIEVEIYDITGALLFQNNYLVEANNNIHDIQLELGTNTQQIIFRTHCAQSSITHQILIDIINLMDITTN